MEELFKCRAQVVNDIDEVRVGLCGVFVCRVVWYVGGVCVVCGGVVCVGLWGVCGGVYGGWRVVWYVGGWVCVGLCGMWGV